MNINNKKKALIHIAKKQLNMTDEEYSGFLSGFGVSSSRLLKNDQWDEVYKHLIKCGFKAVHKSAKKSGMHKKPAKSRERLVSKVEALLADMNLSWGYADELARRICKVDKFRFVDKDDIYKIITALNVQQKKRREYE